MRSANFFWDPSSRFAVAWSTNPADADRPPGALLPRAVLPCVKARHLSLRFDLYFTETEIVEVEASWAAPMPPVRTQIESAMKAWPQAIPNDIHVVRIQYDTIRRAELIGGRAKFSAAGILWWGPWGRDVLHYYDQDSREKNREEAEYAREMVPNILPLRIPIELVDY